MSFQPKSNSNPPEESVTDSGDSSEKAQANFKLKYHSIKAFRTIITMLRFIPSAREMTVVYRKPGRGVEDKELKLLNALATLLVRRNEVAAVAVTNYDGESGDIQVIACHQSSSDSPSGELTVPQTALSSSISMFWNFRATLNPRKDNDKYGSDHLDILDPKDEIPSDLLETKDVDRIRTYCYVKWWVKFNNSSPESNVMYRRKETHGTHAWMLGKLAGSFNFFQEYVVASCFEKMLSRMNNKLLSLPYFDAILNLPNFQFKETHLEPENKENQMEEMFREVLLKLADAKLINTPVTNLLAVMSEHSVELYTNDTCQEFHQLLCELLDRFRRCLENLKSLKDPDRSVFDKAVRKVVCYGEALQVLAGGVTIQKHFQAIEDELTVSHHKRERDVANQIMTLPNVETKVDSDVELESVQPFAIRDGKALTMSKAVKDWLKLMVVQFDAIKIVATHYTQSKITKMTIKVIVPPKLDEEMLPWKDLLHDENLKYTGIKPKVFDPFNRDTTPTSFDIIDFLDKHTVDLAAEKGSSTIFDMQKSVNQLIKSSSYEAVSLNALEALENQLSGLRSGMSPDQSKLTERISSKIEQLKKIDDESFESARNLLYDIAQILESLEVSSLFFKKLRSGSSLSTGKGFNGAPHCEMFLAAVIVMAKKSLSTLPKHVQRELLVSHHFHILVIFI